MPLANRSIQPVWLGRKPLTEGEKEEGVALVAVSHSAVLGALIQLASLVRHADDLFCDLAEECQEIFEKTESIKAKIEHVKEMVQPMDSTIVKIPEGNLREFCQVSNHHVAKHGFDNNLFTTENRPYCIKTRYSMCEVTPVHALRGVDLYRKDGLTSSLLFKLWPITLNETEVKTDNMNIPKGHVNWYSWKKRYKPLRLKPRPKTIHSIGEILLEDTPRELQDQHATALSKSQPSILVSVDTSGAGFERMSSFRRSLKDDALKHGKDRKRRRRTVSGVPDNIWQEIDLFDNDRRITRNGPRQYSLDDLDQGSLNARDEVMQQYLMEIDAQIAERKESEYAEKEGKLLKFIPCRRSRSVPGRCVRMISSMGRKGSSRALTDDKKAQRLMDDEETNVLRQESKSGGLMNRFSSSISLASQGSERLSRSSSRRSSIIGSKIKNLVSGAVKPRPKSLDFDSVGVIDEKKTVKSKPKTRSASMSRMSTATLPEGTNSAAITRSASSESTVGPGSYYYFDSNTLPRAAQRKYAFPWDSLPKDWTTSVKLREISRRRKEDRQSSSGNWSQSGYSSNRQSMDSDAKSCMPSATSQHSLGKDSGRDSPLVEKDSLDNGYMGDAASMESVSDTKSMSNTDSDDWIRSLAERAASRDDVSSTDADVLENLSRLTKENIRNLNIVTPGKKRNRQTRNDLDEDGESSVYSLDQEGFYTSFHNDSGLRRSSNTLLEEDEDLLMPRIRETKSLQSVLTCNESNCGIYQPFLSVGTLPHNSTAIDDSGLDFLPLADTRNVFLSLDSSTSDTLDPEGDGLEYGDTGTLKAKKKNRKVPPPPPPRTSSCLKHSKKSSSTESSSEEKDSPPLTETSSESSDQEVIYARLKLKTGITAHSFPSWCASVTSDEEECLINASHERLNAEYSEVQKMLQPNGNGWLNGTLPRGRNLRFGKSDKEEKDYPANSWPRFKKPGTTFHQGILRTPEKDKNRSWQPKVLNFAPVVNLFDAQTPGGVQMPLSRLSSSDESNSPPASDHLKSPPAFIQPTSKSYAERIEMKKVNAALVTSTDEDLRQSGCLLNLTIGDRTKVPQDVNTTSKAQIHSNTSISSFSSPSPSQQSQDSFYGVKPMPLEWMDKSELSLGSNSTIGLSDIDSSSLTHVSLDDSTPSGSTLSLNWDTDNTPNPTPTATPAQTHKIINHSANDLSSPSAKTDFKSSINDFRLHPTSVICDESDMLDLPPPPPPPMSLDLPSPLSSSFDSNAMSPILPPPPLVSNDENVFLNNSQGQKSFSFIHNQQKSSIVSEESARNARAIPFESKDQISRTQIYGYSNSSESSDNNNNNSQGRQIQENSSVPYFRFPEASRAKQTTQQPGEKSDNAISSKRVAPHSANSFQYNQSWSGVSVKNDQKANRGQQEWSQVRSQRSERRRSSPVTAAMIEPSWDCMDNSHRRRSGSSLLSPADSGFGSPSGISETTAASSYFPGPLSKTNFSNHRPASAGNNYQQQHQQHQPVVLRAPNTPQIKKPMIPDSHNIHRKGDERSQRYSSGSSSQSSESLNSQLSISSTNHLIPRPKSNAADVVQPPILLRGNSADSLSSNSSAGRSDSYRVALSSDSKEYTSLIPKVEKQKQVKYPSMNESGSHKSRSFSLSADSSSTAVKSRPVLSKSVSTPSPRVNEEAIQRVDSYRCAIQNAQANVLGNWMARNSSYRLATNEEDVVMSDHRMDSCNLWTGTTGAMRDVRRMGITDVDQLKSYNDNNNVKDKQGSQKTPETIHAKKKLAVKTDQYNPVVKESPVELRRPSRGHKDKSKQKPQPSSYIRFDPIFESGEDLRASSESLRPPSITSIQTLIKNDSNNSLIGRKISTRSPAQRRSLSSGRKGSDEKPSFLGSIKTTIKSIGGSRGDS